ncbi:hypothetical protein [Rhodococcus opacus]|uniref:Uncharacterized protein n=2 Tax=Nocardiaceae TaxID=85025 RepID=C1BDR8_RHOOB|nr:hypothetical protein [Rhodococcus opacus]UNN04723.1 hypothetical protein MOO23_37555 [Rhodococcus opacus]BAH47121.1 hypothetical protein ROP_pROB02-01080 [Rhodococcus opacus B4]
MMELAMADRRAVATAIATRRAGYGENLDELCARDRRHSDHARKALGVALIPKAVHPRTAGPPTYEPNVVAALIFCWAALAMGGKRLAPTLADLVPTSYPLCGRSMNLTAGLRSH